MAIGMPRPAYVRFNGNNLSDHNRSDVSVELDRIEQRTRVASGRMRKFYVADKHSFGLSWSDLPETAAKTIDGKWGASEIISFYHSTPGEFTLGLVQSNGTLKTYTVVFTDFSANPVKRWGTYYYDLSLSLEEV